MTVYLETPGQGQPAFIYANYPPGTTASASSSAAGYAPENVLQAEEAEGWRPLSHVGTHVLTVSNSQAVDVIAMQGKALDGISIKVEAASTPEGSRTELLATTVIDQNETVYLRIAQGSQAYLIYTFTNVSNVFTVKHIVASQLALLPFLEDGLCLAPLQAEGDHLVSQSGYFLGSVTTRVMRPFSLDWGQVDDVEEVAFAKLVSSCVATAQGLFFIPDASSTDIYFGTIDKKYKYEPKMKLGLYDIPTIPFTSRA